MKKFLVVLTVIVAISFSFNVGTFNKAEAATVNQQLTQPEEGWKRFNNDYKSFKYSSNMITSTDSKSFQGDHQLVPDTNPGNGRLEFKFKGTQFRIISLKIRNGYTFASSNVKVNIDGKTETYNPINGNDSYEYQILLYEKTGLEDAVHSVEIYTDDNKTLVIDAIDIDADGEIYPPDTIAESLKLNKEALELTVSSSESLVATITPEHGTNKVIQWTSSDPEIASVDDNGNVIGKKPGKVTITAETTDGSNLSATAEVTVKESETAEIGTRAILRLTMTTKDIHEYDLSLSEIDQFMNWLDGREVGQGKPYYKFKLNVTIGNIVSRTEYIMYDKIVSFTVDDYK
ncbi:Ig-like domain-containing protein [Lysinibacillus sp. NPDC048646]|uniref:Ig-like domain-containing protein n=1 Tax=Lysinibacillus sp. NPDC048646 TaxID=3390574 RepID=UPI003D01A07C